MHLKKYLATKKTISSILVTCEKGLLSGEQAAAAILVAIVPTMERAIGMENYFACAKGWLSHVLLVEPKLTLDRLTERLNTLTTMSPEMRLALGGIAGRLNLLNSL